MDSRNETAQAWDAASIKGTNQILPKISQCRKLIFYRDKRELTLNQAKTLSLCVGMFWCLKELLSNSQTNVRTMFQLILGMVSLLSFLKHWHHDFGARREHFHAFDPEAIQRFNANLPEDCQITIVRGLR